MPEPWTRRGRLLMPEDLPGNHRLLQMPFCWELANGLLRIAVSARDAQNRAHVFSFDADPEDDMRIHRVDPAPIYSPDRFPGATSVGLSCVLRDTDGQMRAFGGALWLTPPNYQISIFTCTSDDDGQSFSDPVIVLPASRNGGLPVLSGCVRREGPLWRMWYTAFEEWRPRPGQDPDARYCIRHATSQDGLQWAQDVGFALARRSDAEAGIISPTVISDKHGYEMWCSLRGPYSDANPQLRRYRLIRATSENGERFAMDTQARVFGNPPVPGDWDHDMQCYPHLLRAGNRPDILLYVGNGYGAAGVGWASRPAGSSDTYQPLP